jgi:hypothetical protein
VPGTDWGRHRLGSFSCYLDSNSLDGGGQPANLSTLSKTAPFPKQITHPLEWKLLLVRAWHRLGKNNPCGGAFSLGECDLFQFGDRPEQTLNFFGRPIRESTFEGKSPRAGMEHLSNGHFFRLLNTGLLDLGSRVVVLMICGILCISSRAWHRLAYHRMPPADESEESIQSLQSIQPIPDEGRIRPGKCQHSRNVMVRFVLTASSRAGAQRWRTLQVGAS